MADHENVVAADRQELDRLKFISDPVHIMNETFWMITKSSPKSFLLLALIFITPLSFCRQSLYNHLPNFLLSYWSFMDHFLSNYPAEKNETDHDDIFLTDLIFNGGFMKYFLLKYLTFVILYTLSIMAVIYTVTSVYTRQPPKLHPRVFKPLIVTFSHIFFYKSLNNISFWFTMIILKKMAILQDQNLYVFISYIGPPSFLVIDAYYTHQWGMTTIITILEYSQGIFGSAAIEKSRELLREKTMTNLAAILNLYMIFSIVCFRKGGFIIYSVVFDLFWLVYQSIHYYARVRN